MCELFNKHYVGKGWGNIFLFLRVFILTPTCLIFVVFLFCFFFFIFHFWFFDKSLDFFFFFLFLLFRFYFILFGFITKVMTPAWNIFDDPELLSVKARQKENEQNFFCTHEACKRHIFVGIIPFSFWPLQSTYFLLCCFFFFFFCFSFLVALENMYVHTC